MTGAPPKPRPWFQLHLSTCVVLMVVAGVLAMLNFRSPHMPIWWDQDITRRSFGWPLEVVHTLSDGDANRFEPYRWGDSGSFEINYDAVLKICLNALLNLMIMIGAARLSEYLIRRRARKRQDPAP